MITSGTNQCIRCSPAKNIDTTFPSSASWPTFPSRRYFSLSLSKDLEREFLEETSLPPSTLVIRAPVHQPHIRYHVISVEPGRTTTLRFAVDLAKLLTTEVHGSSKRGIIFCTLLYHPRHPPRGCCRVRFQCISGWQTDRVIQERAFTWLSG